MTIELTTETSGDAAAIPGHYHFRGVLGTEWIKVRSVRSTVWTLLTTAIVGVGLGAIVTSAQAARFDTRSLVAQQTFDPTRSSLAGFLFAQLAIGVLGVLIVSAEYSTGTIRATFSAIPRWLLVLAAKTLLFGAIVLVVGEAVAFVTFFVGQSILSGHTPTASLSDTRRATRSDFSGPLPCRARAPRTRTCWHYPPYRGGHQRLRGHALRPADYR